MAKHLLAIIGLIFAGLAVWPAGTDSAAISAPTAGARSRAAEVYRLGAPPACREPANPPLAHSLLDWLGLARTEAPRGRQPSARLCLCTVAAGAVKTVPGH